MGEAKARARAILDLSRVCIFCGGNAPSETVDHQPARALFDRKEWPEGYAFPACWACNQKSKDAENKLALLVRIDSNEEENPQRRADFQKYLQAMANNFPGLLRPLSTREKRQLFKEEGFSRPPGGFADLPIAGMLAHDAEQAFDLAFPKMLRALHFKHTGNIAPEGKDIVTYRWFTNAYVQILESEQFAPFKCLPAVPPMKRNGHDLSDQFGYRYGTDQNGMVSAFLMRFRMSMIVVGLVVQSNDLLPKERADDSSAPA
jgi:hypothetical protein